MAQRSVPHRSTPLLSLSAHVQRRFFNCTGAFGPEQSRRQRKENEIRETNRPVRNDTTRTSLVITLSYTRHSRRKRALAEGKPVVRSAW